MIHPSFLRRSDKDPAAMNANSLMLSIIFYLAFGFVLIFLKDQAIEICGYVLAGLLLLFAGYQLFIYISSPAIRKVTESRLAYGLISLLTGGLLLFNPRYLETALPLVWGLFLLFGAFIKIQYAFDQLSLKVSRWWIMLIFAAISMVIGILTLTNRTVEMDQQKYIFIGIMLILEAVLDIVVFFLKNHALKRLAVFSDSTLVPEDKVAPLVPAVQDEVAVEEEKQSESK